MAGAASARKSRTGCNSWLPPSRGLKPLPEPCGRGVTARDWSAGSTGGHWCREDYYDGYVEKKSDGGAAVSATARKDRCRRSDHWRRTNHVCSLSIAIDHLLYTKFTELHNNALRTCERLATLTARHVARASEVCRCTNCGGIEDVSFNVLKIKFAANVAMNFGAVSR